MTLDRTTHPRRDRATLITYGQFAMYGWFLYAFGPSVPLLRDEYGVTSTVAALHGTLVALAALLVGLGAPRVVRHLGRGGSLRAGSVLLIIGVLIYTSGHSLALTMLGAFVAGLGGGLVAVFGNAHLSAHQGEAAPSALSEAAMMSAVFGMIAPLTLGLGVAIGWGWRPGLLVTALGVLALELLRGPTTAFNDTERPHDQMPEPVPLPHLFWWAWGVLVALVGVEFCLILWSSDLLRLRGGFGPGAAAASLTSVVAGMALGRGVGSVLARRLDTERLLMGAIALAFVAFAAAWLSNGALPILIALFATGCGVGLHWPLGISRAIRATNHQADRASARVVVGAGLASGGAPFILGALADAFGVHTAFLVVPVLLVVALALVIARPISTGPIGAVPLIPL